MKRSVKDLLKNVLKASLAVVLVASLSPHAVLAQQLDPVDKFEQYRIEAINQELAQHGYSMLTDSRFSLSDAIDPTTSENIQKLKDAEIVIMDINEFGKLSSAESSQDGDAIDRFAIEKREIDDSTESTPSLLQSNETQSEAKSNLSLQSILGNTSPAPEGYKTGAFHRLISPTSNSSINYSGAVADDVTLPNFKYANGDGEAAYLYTGIDQNGVGIAEIGFGTYNGTKGKGWFPLFHARAAHTINTQPGNEPNSTEYIYDYSKNYGSGDKTITGYKVFYKTTDATLTVTYQIGYNTIYVVKFSGYNSQNKAVKRVTAIAMSKDTGATTKYINKYNSYANWGNYRFLTQNGSGTVYPAAVSGIVEHTWSHGGTIDYIKNVISSTDRDEKYLFY
jgi:hypothetical protein